MKRFTLSSLDGLDLSAVDPALARPRFNIAHDQDALVAVQRSGARALAGMRWGMLSPWRGHGGKRPPSVYDVASMPGGLDVRSGSVPAFVRNAVRTQRCLVIADGWFAWRRTRSSARPYWIHPPAPGPVAFAGIWSVHADDDRPSFAILVTSAGPTLSSIASSTPIPAGDAWLGPLDTALAALDGSCDHWRADAVSPWVNDEAHDDPRCIAPLGNPAQGELF